MKNLDFAVYSDMGGRTNNEDAYWAKQTEQGGLFIVADGLGGHDCGEVASWAAVYAIKDYFEKNGDKDPVQMSLGMEMQLSTCQSVF